MVEDSESDAALALRELTKNGRRLTVKRVDTEADFLAALDRQGWDLVLCDFSMPHFNGLTALQLFRQRNLDIPFIFVSGAISEDTAVGAMKAGAHDYVMKTNLKRLAPAVEREIREASERREKRMLAEEASRIRVELQKRDELFRSLIEHSSDGILLVDADGLVVYESPSINRILGYEPESEQRFNFFDLIHPGDLERTKNAFAHLLKSPGGISTDELRVRHRDNSWRWIETVSHNLLRDEKIEAMVVNFRDITFRKHAEEQLRRSQEQLRALAANLQIAREEERRTIAREFHDQLGQSLTAMKMSLSLLRREVANPDKEYTRAEIASEIHALQQEIDRAAESVRHTMAELRPEMLDQFGIVATLGWEAERFAKRSGIRCTFTSNTEELRLDPHQSIALYRIFQEAITNVSRHSHATLVEATLSVSDQELMLSIRDNGVGIDSGAESRVDSFGLTGMRERAHLLNGSFEIIGEKETGTIVTIRMPMTPKPTIATRELL